MRFSKGFMQAILKISIISILYRYEIEGFSCRASLGTVKMFKRRISMDDEREREGIKLDITAREDDYLSSRFLRLSSSGHDITPMSDEDKFKSIAIKEQEYKGQFLGDQQKGIYVSKIGGLPLFASGYRVDNMCNSTSLVFTEPCDPDHVVRKRDQTIFCKRSGICLGCIQIKTLSNKENNQENHIENIDMYIINSNTVRFYEASGKWPVESQPENYWGSEGQYRAWNQHELDSTPLSY